MGTAPLGSNETEEVEQQNELKQYTTHKMYFTTVLLSIFSLIVHSLLLLSLFH